MAIAPIDLQTLFTQADKAARAQTPVRESHSIHQAVHGTVVQKKTEVQIKQVNEAQNLGNGIEKIQDQVEGRQGESKEGKENEKESFEQEEPGEDSSPVLNNPNLGSKIDISV